MHIIRLFEFEDGKKGDGPSFFPLPLFSAFLECQLFPRLRLLLYAFRNWWSHKHVRIRITAGKPKGDRHRGWQGLNFNAWMHSKLATFSIWSRHGCDAFLDPFRTFRSLYHWKYCTTFSNTQKSSFVISKQCAKLSIFVVFVKQKPRVRGSSGNNGQ